MIRTAQPGQGRPSRILLRFWAVLAFLLQLGAAAARADSLLPVSLSTDQIKALLGDPHYDQDGFALDLDALSFRFLDKVETALPGLPLVSIVPLALDEDVRFEDFGSALTGKLKDAWTSQLPHTCQERHTFNPATVRIDRVTASDLFVSFAARYEKYVCWNFDAPKCTIDLSFQKCKMEKVTGNTRLFDKRIEFSLVLHATVTPFGLTLVPTLAATNVDDVERLFKVVNFLRPLIQLSLGSMVSPTVGLVLGLPQVQIIPKLRGPNERIHEIGIDPYRFSLGDLKASQMGKLQGLATSAAGALSIGSRLDSLVLRSASFSWREGALHAALLMVTPDDAAPPPSEAEADRAALISVIDGLARYQASLSHPVTEYTVAKGDTLWSVADRLYGNPYLHLAIAEQNGMRSNPGLRTGEVIKVTPYHELVDNVDRLVGNGGSAWLLARQALGSGDRYRSIQVGDRPCGAAGPIYPAEAWRIRPSLGCTRR